VTVPGTGYLLASRYRLQEQIADGGVGSVWRARDEVLGRAVAVKLLRPEYAGHAETLARFQAEAQHAARLAHPGIVQVYDYGQDDGTPFLVMELIDGPSLAEVIAGGPLQAQWVSGMIAQVAAGLAAAHEAGLVHRDIKPGNLLIAPGGFMKITDFGISSATGAAPLTRTGMLACTPGYMAPERAAGVRATAASDLYSLGVVAWECLSGAPPFTGTPIEILHGHTHQGLPPLPPGVPAGLAALVAELTAKDPAARPASARQLADRLGADVATQMGQPPTGRHSRPTVTRTLAPVTVHDLVLSVPERPGRPSRRARMILLAAAGLAAVTVAAVAVAMWPSASTGQHLTASRPSPSAPAVRTVTVNAAVLDGQSATAVLTQLRQAGLEPSLARRPDWHAEPGTVITVQPAGSVPAGTAVTVTEAVQPLHHHHHHDGGKGNGD
jgi:serine/threonine protein kinase